MFRISNRSRLLSRDDVARATLDEVTEANDRARRREARGASPRPEINDAAVAAELDAQGAALSGSHEERRAALDAIRAAAHTTASPASAGAPSTARPVSGAPPAGWYTGPTGERWLWDGAAWIASARS